MSKGQHDRRARSAEQAAEAATSAAGAAAATAAQRAGAAVQRAGTALEQQGRTSAPAVGAVVGSAVENALEVADSARTVAERVGAGALGVAGELVETVSGLIEEPGARGAAALEALRGVPVRPPAARRRWPWAVAAAVAGATAGAGAALLVRRLSGGDAVDAQEPHELRAVVDVPADPVSGGPVQGSTTAQPGVPPAAPPSPA